MTRKLIGVLGELLLTLGSILLLYVAYSLWFSNTLVETQNQVAAERFLQSLPQNNHTTPVITESPQEVELTEEPEEASFNPVEPYGLLYIPRLKSDVWQEPLVEGIYYRALASGVGHYPTTEQPGEIGNFAIAGHRATNGEPFARFEKLQAGDRVYVQTAVGWFEYELVQDKIVQEDEVWVLADNPLDQGFAPGGRLITLTTCDPRWNSYQRWVWWGKLVAQYPLDQTPQEILGG